MPMNDKQNWGDVQIDITHDGVEVVLQGQARSIRVRSGHGMRADLDKTDHFEQCCGHVAGRLEPTQAREASVAQPRSVDRRLCACRADAVRSADEGCVT